MFHSWWHFEQGEALEAKAAAGMAAGEVAIVAEDAGAWDSGAWEVKAAPEAMGEATGAKAEVDLGAWEAKVDWAAREAMGEAMVVVATEEAAPGAGTPGRRFGLDWWDRKYP